MLTEGNTGILYGLFQICFSVTSSFVFNINLPVIERNFPLVSQFSVLQCLGWMDYVSFAAFTAARLSCSFVIHVWDYSPVSLHHY